MPKLHGHVGVSVSTSGAFSDASSQVSRSVPQQPHAHAHAHAHVHAQTSGHGVIARSAGQAPKTKIGKKLKAVEWQQEMITKKTRCTYCGSSLTLLRRPVSIFCLHSFQFLKLTFISINVRNALQ